MLPHVVLYVADFFVLLGQKFKSAQKKLAQRQIDDNLNVRCDSEEDPS